MNPNEVEITTHAVMRFCTRYNGPPPKNPEEEIRALLADALPEDIGSVGRAIRLINNGFEPARYYMASGWRFVLTDDGTRLLTCERRIRKRRGPPRKKRR